MDWKIEEIPGLRGFTIEYAAPDDFILSRRNILYRSDDLKLPFEEIATVDAPFWKPAASKIRLAQRLLRFQVTNVLQLSNGDLFVSFDKTVGIIRDGKFRQIKGLLRPCRILRSACAVDEFGNLFFGEYLANDDRGEMNVYRYQPGSEFFEVAYKFPPKSIKHIHGIYLDDFTKSLFCLTGDDASECRFLQTFDGFKTVEAIGEGDETWRAVSMLFTENALYYGTDAEFQTNHIYRIDRVSEERTQLGEVSGTVFYSKKVGGDLFFATTAENAPSQTENVAAIWNLKPDGQLTELIKFPKDRWHPTYFQFGTIHFPAVNNFSDQLFFHLVGVEGDNSCFKIFKV